MSTCVDKLKSVTSKVLRKLKKSERTLHRAGYIEDNGDLTKKGATQARQILYENAIVEIDGKKMTCREALSQLAEEYVAEAERQAGL